MAPLPRPFSIAASEIQSAILDGRASDAMYALMRALESGRADRATQLLAARWIETVGLKPGDAKALRGGEPAFPQDWLAVSAMVTERQVDGETYADAVAAAAKYFGCSDRHVQKCVAMRNEATEQ